MSSSNNNLTGVLYHHDMTAHYHPRQKHPEQPLRIERIYQSISHIFGEPLDYDDNADHDEEVEVEVLQVAESEMIQKSTNGISNTENSAGKKGSREEKRRLARKIREDSFNLLHRLNEVLETGTQFDSSDDEDDIHSTSGSSSALLDVDVMNTEETNGNNTSAAVHENSNAENKPSQSSVEIAPDFIALLSDNFSDHFPKRESSSSSSLGASSSLVKLKFGPVSKETLLRVHERAYWERMEQKFEACNGKRHEGDEEDEEDLVDFAKRFDSIYLNPNSLRASLLSCGAVVEAVKCVGSTQIVDNAFAIVRPPGHHAEAHCCMGFCLLNNVAVATKEYLNSTINDNKRVMIVDWDVHHGNGTQRVFYEDPNVLYVSLHRFDGATFYPSSDEANCNYIGRGKGIGKNVNVAWNGGPYGDAEYLYAFERLIMPIGREFNPTLVIISAGFDAAAGDPIGGFSLSPLGYAHMTYMLRGLADGKVVIALEGGYNLNSISAASVACVSVLQGNTPPSFSFSTEDNINHYGPKINAVRDVERALLHLSPYWKCLYPRSEGIIGSAVEKIDPHFQTNCSLLSDQHLRWYESLVRESAKLIAFPMADPILEDVFQGRVYASENLMDVVMEKLPIVLMIHEMPSIQYKSPILSNTLDPSQTYMYEPLLRLQKTLFYSRKMPILDIALPSNGRSSGGAVSEAEFRLLSYLKQTRCLDCPIILLLKLTSPTFTSQILNWCTSSSNEIKLKGLIVSCGGPELGVPGIEEKVPTLKLVNAAANSSGGSGFVYAEKYREIIDFIDDLP